MPLVQAATRFVNYPASSDHTIAVAATTAEPAPEETRSASFSNVGPAPGTDDFSGGESAGAEPDLGAPGMKLAALRGTTSQTTFEETLSGTSMAAPLVAGGVAALLESTGSMEFDDLTDRLERTAQPAEQVAEAEVGAGLLDLDAAVSDDEREETQADAMDDEAVTRDEAFRSESDWRGRPFLGVFD
ncbi:subtilisin-like serine protease [Halalkaliarchaeum desulfuricum]|uniref:Subtilisin-like serine protease n=1 Tax=Halalkaliarchaeum desulfuricum TaxID=2055893 RepID=A0A343TJK1_9EURY|nr:S8 family serine peptidase [Halalkaliarchaeum desulfuricum]AUX09273.1 subtilisin-like serine protease [Halalkaliarchaeum desulfuricum]